MWVVDRIARELEHHPLPQSPEERAELIASVERECGPGTRSPGTIAAVREAAEDLVNSLLCEQSDKPHHGGNLRAAAEAWADEHLLDWMECPVCGRIVSEAGYGAGLDIVAVEHASGCPLADNP